MLESSKDIISNTPSFKKIKKSLEESHNYSNNFKIPTEVSHLDIKDKDRKTIETLLSSTPVAYELLTSETGLSLPVVYTICLELELAGKIARHSGNKISLIY